MMQAYGAHSAHAPVGPQAMLLDRLGDLLYVVSAVVFLLVVTALLAASHRRRSEGEPLDDPARERRMTTAVTIAAGATAAILVFVMLASFAVGRRLTAAVPPGAVQIRVTGHQWWWEVEYRDADPQRWATTANELHVPVGRPVAIELRTTDVIHSFWVPNLGVKRDMIPGEATSVWFQADTPGVYRGQCAEFCGRQHAMMGFVVVAEPARQFAAWLDRQRDSARTPADSLANRGQKVFLASSCARCHAVAGTPAAARLGPNLTHLAGRRTIAAATLPNRAGHLAGWILDPQAVKPGALMPSTELGPEQLHALLAYLESLE